jgi:hypothetical protein
MKSLKSQALSKLPILTNKTLIEILRLCEDENNAMLCQMIFTREGLFALFEGYMTGTPNANSYIKTRIELRNILEFRQDIQTDTQCEHFFKAIVQGFKWDYIMTLSGPHRDENYFSAHSRLGHGDVIEGPKLELQGTLPEVGCLGLCLGLDVSFEDFHYDDGGFLDDFDEMNPNPPTILVWPPSMRIASDAKVRKILFTSLLNQAKIIAIDHIYSRDGGNLENVTFSDLVISLIGPNDDVPLYQADLDTTDPNFEDSFSFLLEVLATLEVYDFSVNSENNLENDFLEITLHDLTGDGKMSIMIHHSVFKM